MEDNLQKLPLLLYDSECTMCMRFKDALSRLPGGENLQMISIHNPAVYDSYPELTREQCHQTVHLITEEKKIIKGSEVVEYLIHFYPGISKFAWLIENQVGKKAVDIFYEVVNRYRQSNLNDCKGCKQ